MLKEAFEAVLTNLPFWDHLSEEEKDVLRAQADIRHYPKEKIFLGCADECLGMVYVCRGALRVFLLSPGGREVTLFSFGKAEWCVLSASCILTSIQFETQMIATEDTDLLVIHASAFSRLAVDNIYVRSAMYELLTSRFSSVVNVMQQILFMGFDQRLAAYLLEESEKSGTDSLRVTHEAIAVQINSSREVVSRCLGKFESDGLVSLHRGEIRLLAPEKLRDLL